MKTVYKYLIKMSNTFSVEMQAGATILTVQIQKSMCPNCETREKEYPCIWALADTLAEKETRTFKLIGTGYPLQENTQDTNLKDTNLNYIGTFQLYQGGFVGHVFEVVKPK